MFQHSHTSSLNLELSYSKTKPLEL